MDRSALISLLQLADLTLPIGGFSHSAGLETYVQQGVVHDLNSAAAFVKGMLSHNIRYNDAAFLSLAYDHTAEENFGALIQLDAYCTATKLPREIRQASNKLGIRLLKNFQPLLSFAFVEQYQEAIEAGSAAGHYSIAFGLIAAGMKIPKKDALTGFFYNTAAGMITNAVKLVPLGQHDGQKLLFSLHSLIAELAELSIHPDQDMIGICSPGFDIRCMQHEQLYSRLYMS